MAGVKSKLGGIWLQFCEESSFHGVKYFTANPKNYVMRFIWLILVVIMFGSLLYGFHDLYSMYIKYDYQTSSHVKYSKDLKIPPVCFNFRTPFDENKVNYTDKRFRYIYGYNMGLPTQYDAEGWNDTVITEDYLKDISFSAKDLFFFGMYNRYHINYSDFTTIYQSPIYPHYCYNPPENKPRPDDNKDRLIFHINVYSKKRAIKYRIMRSEITMFLGIRNILMERDIQQKTFFPGHSYNFELSEKTYNYLPSPYKSYRGLDCVENTLNLDSVTLMNSYAACYKQCYTDNLIQNCGCITEMAENSANHRYCSVYERVTCADGIYYSIFRAGYTDNKNITCNCRHYCTETVYEQQILSYNFPPKYYLKQMISENVTKSLEHAKENLLTITISFSSSKVENIYHVPRITVFQWLSNVGGFMGLFLGASLLTLIELLFTVLITIIRLCRELVKNIKSSVCN